ncbi:hypothetical protein ACQ4LK_23350, partial [Bacillus pumilus]
MQTLAFKIVQMGISLKLLANGLTEIRTHLYEKMNDDKDTKEESHDLIWQIDRFITPIHNEILNQYSISVSYTHLPSPRDPLHDLVFRLVVVKRGGGGGGGGGG